MKNAIKLFLAAALAAGCLSAFGCSSGPSMSEEQMVEQSQEVGMLALAEAVNDDAKAAKEYYAGKPVQMKAFATKVADGYMKSTVQPQNGLVTFEIRFADKGDLDSVKPSAYNNVVGIVDDVSSDGKTVKIKDAYLLP